MSLGGEFVALPAAGMSSSMPSLIGLIMLMGIATRNSILLVECAIVARPVIMTTLAMGAGLLPIAVGWGAADASFRSPMAVAVIGGLMTSTVLRLLVIPAVFTVVDDFGRWVRRLLRRGTAGIGIKLASSAYAIIVRSYCFSWQFVGVKCRADWVLLKGPTQNPKG